MHAKRYMRVILSKLFQRNMYKQYKETFIFFLDTIVTFLLEGFVISFHNNHITLVLLIRS